MIGVIAGLAIGAFFAGGLITWIACTDHLIVTTHDKRGNQ